MTIAVVDSGVANLASVMAALQKLEVTAEVTANARDIRRAKHVILPGVGSAKAAMEQLETKGLVEVLHQLTQPVLGICLGMQLLFANSEENGGIQGLGVLPGTVEILEATTERPIPHIGWNQLNVRHPNHALLHNIQEDSFVYFVHSYAVPLTDMTLAATNYGKSFSSVVGYKNFFGCQFHPERSGAVGAQILENFLGL